MKKRILSILLLCCMVLTLLPVTAFATGELRDSTNVTVTFDSAGGSEVAPQSVPQGQPAQRPADPIKDGYAFIGWYDKADLEYSNMPEWTFSYPVTKDLELVAQWMETRPISTEPITYLDKDGNQQVCNEYTVLTSNTADSILDLDDKWYDLPAGWYVVKGDVTITPRLDTHGAVNLILTDGSHLTAEWGINVKEGDTFTVYAQSTGEDTMGRLTACLSEDLLSAGYYVWPDYGLSGIGSSRRWRKANSGINENGGTIIINGGNIHAKGQDSASAIGECGYDTVTQSPSSEGRQCGSITINGGIVRTEALARETTGTSIGIGSCRSGYGGSVTINGGTVMANAFNDAICTGRGGSITINGGDITARGGLGRYGRGNGIGPSWITYADITINGGNIDASANGAGAAIGGVLSTTVKITGGTIKAVGDYATVAIGSNEGRGGSVSITGGKVTAIGKGDAAGIGGFADVSITGGEIDVSVEGSGVAIGGNGGGSINIQGNAIKSISSRSGACIGGSAENITILDAELPFLGGEGILIGNRVSDDRGGNITIRNCRILSTDVVAVEGIQLGNNGNIQIENSEIVLTGIKGIRTGDSGSIAIRDSQLVTNGIYMGEEGMTQRKLKRLEITNSTVVTNDVLGSTGKFTSVGEIVIHGSSIRQSSEDRGNGFGIGCGEYGTFDRIDIQDSQIDIPGFKDGVAIGGGRYTKDPGNSVIRIANSRVFARTRDRWSTAIGRGVASSGDGALRIFIENSTVTAKGGWLFGDDTEYVPGIGISYKSSLNAYIQVMDSTVESFRHTKSRNMDDSDYVYDDLHTKKLPGIPAENISICGSTVNGTRIDHSLDKYGKCSLCGKYDIGYCYEKGLLTMEGLTDCAYDGSEKKLTGLSHKTGENETKQLTENTDYTATYSNNVYPYTLNPNDAGFDPEKAPKVTLYGTGNYCGKAEHYFTISGDEQPSYTVKFDTAGGTSISNKTGVRWEQRVLDGVEPPTRTDYEFRGWSCSGKPVFPGTTYEALHEAIISPEVWNEVQAINRERTLLSADNAPPKPFLFTGKLICTDCKAPLQGNRETQRRKNGTSKKYVSYFCSRYTASGYGTCSRHTIYEMTLTELVLSEIRAHAEALELDEAAMLDRLQAQRTAADAERLESVRQEIGELRRRVYELEQMTAKLYEDKVCGSISAASFAVLLEKTEQERRQRTDRLDTLLAEVREYEQSAADIQSWAAVVRKHLHIRELDRETVDELIDRIEVGEKTVIDGKNVRDIKIYYRFVGNI